MLKKAFISRAGILPYQEINIKHSTNSSLLIFSLQTFVDAAKNHNFANNKNLNIIQEKIFLTY